jgi:hypothetical protein
MPCMLVCWGGWLLLKEAVSREVNLNHFIPLLFPVLTLALVRLLVREL